MASLALKRGYFAIFAVLFALLFLSTVWIKWFRSLGGASTALVPLSPTAAADAHYRKLRQDLLHDNDLRQITGDLRPKLWVFLDRRRSGMDWAGTTFRTNRALAPYVRACIRSIKRHNATDFRVMFIDDRAFQHLVVDWPWGDLSTLGETQRRCMRRVGQLHVLYLYGGLQVPASFWCRRPLRPLFDAALSTGGNTAAPFCVRMPAASAARPLLPPKGDNGGGGGGGGDDNKRRAFWPGDIGAEEGPRGVCPPQLVFQTYTVPDAASLDLGFFGCRPHCHQVRRLIDQIRFQAGAVGESEELAFHGSGNGTCAPDTTLCAGRWTALPLVPSSEAAAPGSSYLAGVGGTLPNVHQATLARLQPPSTANPPSGVRRVGLHLLRTNGPWKDLPGVPLVHADVRSIDAGIVGRVDCRGDSVTLAQLLSATPVQFQDNAYGVWIPEDELLASRYYDWFPGMGLQTMKGKEFVLAGLLSGEIDDVNVDAAWSEKEGDAAAAAAADDAAGTTDADATNPFAAAMDVTSTCAVSAK